MSRSLKWSVMLLTFALPAPAQASALDDCLQIQDAERRIAGCSALIEGGRWTDMSPADAYRNRAEALRNLGDLDRAILDFERAERLDPSMARLYDRLGAMAALSDRLTGDPSAQMCTCEDPPAAPPVF